MALLVVARDPGHGFFIELEGRRLKVGDLIWVPLGSPEALVTPGFDSAVFLGANCFERVLRVRLENGTVHHVSFDVGVRRRDAGMESVS
jgi:hypothetical protein